MTPAAPDFVAQFHRAVDDLDRTGRSDTETMWLLGSLAARLVTEAHADNWTDLKLKLTPESLEELVVSLERQAGMYETAGKTKPSYVAKLLGFSLVAGRVGDATLQRRDQMLNSFIDIAATVFIQSHPDGITRH